MGNHSGQTEIVWDDTAGLGREVERFLSSRFEVETRFFL